MFNKFNEKQSSVIQIWRRPIRICFLVRCRIYSSSSTASTHLLFQHQSIFPLVYDVKAIIFTIWIFKFASRFYVVLLYRLPYINDFSSFLYGPETVTVNLDCNPPTPCVLNPPHCLLSKSTNEQTNN